jgi:hypothetical protein
VALAGAPAASAASYDLGYRCNLLATGSTWFEYDCDNHWMNANPSHYGVHFQLTHWDYTSSSSGGVGQVPVLMDYDSDDGLAHTISFHCYNERNGTVGPTLWSWTGYHAGQANFQSWGADRCSRFYGSGVLMEVDGYWNGCGPYRSDIYLGWSPNTAQIPGEQGEHYARTSGC